MKKLPKPIDPLILNRYRYLRELVQRQKNNISAKDELLQLSVRLLDNLIPEHNQMLVQLKSPTKE